MCFRQLQCYWEGQNSGQHADNFSETNTQNVAHLSVQPATVHRHFHGPT